MKCRDGYGISEIELDCRAAGADRGDVLRDDLTVRGVIAVGQIPGLIVEVSGDGELRVPLVDSGISAEHVGADRRYGGRKPAEVCGDEHFLLVAGPRLLTDP